MNVSLEEWGTFILRKAEDSTFFPPPHLLIITEIAGMHDPENKAESWEDLLDASPSSLLLSIVSLPSWMPPTPGMSEVEAVAPSPEEHPFGTLTLLQLTQLLRLRKKVKIVSD